MTFLVSTNKISMINQFASHNVKTVYLALFIKCISVRTTMVQVLMLYIFPSEQQALGSF